MNAPPRATTRHNGFTMTELLVVIGVIAVLAGILLAAMGGVRRRALQTRTESTMQQFSSAAETFQLEHGRYPGIIPEIALADDALSGSNVPGISGTEGALLDLMGGGVATRDPSDPDFATFGGCEFDFGSTAWRLKFDASLLGEGPRIDGKRFAPYFTPGESAVRIAEGQAGETDDCPIPDLIDAWGQPIIYLRRVRATGPLVGVLDSNPQFLAAAMRPYTESTGLGEFGRDQTDTSARSIFSTFTSPPDEARLLAQILRHPAFGPTVEEDGVDAPLDGTPRGAYVLISAGADGIFFSRQDGPGTQQMPIGEGDLDLEGFLTQGPGVIDEFDDVRVFGGG